MPDQTPILIDYRPDTEKCFAIVPGRYFIGFFYFDLPDQITKFKQGGNFNCLVWREGEDDARGAAVEWIIGFRFRHYRDGGEDELHWKSQVTQGTAQWAEQSAKDWVNISSALAGADPIYTMIHGGYDRAREILEKTPPIWFDGQWKRMRRDEL